MKKKRVCSYKRLNKSDRIAIENALNKEISCRQIAIAIGRSASSVNDEIRRNRIITRGENKGECALNSFLKKLVLS